MQHAESETQHGLNERTSRADRTAQQVAASGKQTLHYAMELALRNTLLLVMVHCSLSLSS